MNQLWILFSPSVSCHLKIAGCLPDVNMEAHECPSTRAYESLVCFAPCRSFSVQRRIYSLPWRATESLKVGLIFQRIQNIPEIIPNTQLVLQSYETSQIYYSSDFNFYALHTFSLSRNSRIGGVLNVPSPGPSKLKHVTAQIFEFISILCLTIIFVPQISSFHFQTHQNITQILKSSIPP